jgi:hypothetical protein
MSPMKAEVPAPQSQISSGAWRSIQERASGSAGLRAQVCHRSGCCRISRQVAVD